MRDHLLPASRAWAKEHKREDDGTHTEQTRVLGELVRTTANIAEKVDNPDYDALLTAFRAEMKRQKFWGQVKVGARRLGVKGVAVLVTVVTILGGLATMYQAMPDIKLRLFGAAPVAQSTIEITNHSFPDSPPSDNGAGAAGGPKAPATAIIHPQKGR